MRIKTLILDMIRIIMYAALISLGLSGCAGTAQEVSGNGIISSGNEALISEESDYADAESMTEIYRDVFDSAVETDDLDSLDTIRRIVAGFGRNGFPAVDSENQTDMVCPEQIRQFCGQVEAGNEAEAALIVVISAVDFIRYDFTTKDGAVDVKRSYFSYEGGEWKTVSVQNYPAYTWVYSGEGYLFFEEYHMPGYDGPSGHTAVRVEPLDETCRELCEKYLSPIGYQMNNLFTCDWSENDFGEVNFYDLYEPLCLMNGGQYAEASFHEGVSYEIPESEFESVYMNFFRIEAQTLREYTVFHEETHTYQYRTRGMFDFAPTPYQPYPEVISYEVNEDGTITLIVNAVWTEQNLERALCHEVVIRPLEGGDGGFLYVSNHVIFADENAEMEWYTERLADKEWQDFYGR